ncbi:MAG: glutaminyl-peptide cyclotransferase [Sphingobacteriales bacterium]|jgi:glutaminyl-peptide cyclotransferase
MKVYFIAISLVFVLFSCSDEKPTNEKSKSTSPEKVVTTPIFNADSAYHFIEKQVAFGPRVPNSAAHKACGDYLVTKLKSYGASVYQQKATLTAYTKEKLACRNIIAAFNPSATRRILLCAHWDTRPFSDQDKLDKKTPVLGANDGGSGVAVLLEIARGMSKSTPNIGVDIILFDCEDYGDSGPTATQNSYCLGSQHWAKNPPVKGYAPSYGILLDMVGAKGAQFPREGTSMKYAPSIVKKVWDKGNQLGYGDYFVYRQDNGITDDHLYINAIANIPTIDIIEYDSQKNKSGFGEYWHTQQDNMDVISKETLNAVGHTVTEVIYNE